MHYHRLIALVVAANLLLLGFEHDMTPQALAIVAQANFTLAVIVRQHHVINFFYWLATRAPTTWPLKLRWTLAKVYHFGGLHVGAAMSGTLWYLGFIGSLTFDAERHRGNVSAANLIVFYALVALLVVMVVMALPPLRASHHDNFERTHRFGGWAALLLVWANTVLFVSSPRAGSSITSSLLTAPPVWMLLLGTASIASPWLGLRKVSVTVERPSAHAALVGFDAERPLIGSVRPISRHPLGEWHSFATIQSPGGYRMAVSRAGDWTGAFIDAAPGYVWVRGAPIAGMANVRSLFTKVVFVATGSGIGPTMAHLLADEGPSHLLWVTRTPRTTYGDALVDEILAVQPDATIWNTDEHGKPDMLRLAYTAYAASGAEAVICIANKTVTWQVVHGLERLGIPACGPIWDS